MHPSSDRTDEVAREIQRVVREHHGWVIARLVRAVRDLDLAEDALQEALEAALTQWPVQGVPDSPRAWLVRSARNKAIDVLRRRTMRRGKQEEIEWLETLRLEQTQAPVPEDALSDDMLRLIFICCHPALAMEARLALTLRTIAGLTTDEIARAFLVPVPTMAQRLVRATKKIRDAGVPYRVPRQDELDERLSGVLAVIYLVFNEGYTATSGDTHVRRALCSVAIDLGRQVAQLFPAEPEALGLLALMLLQDSRREARIAEDGALVLLEAQDRTLWDQTAIEEGIALTKAALEQSRPSPGPYSLQAAIAAVHAEARSPEETDWPQIAGLYGVLYERAPTAVVALNRAVAIAFAFGFERGLEAMDALAEPLAHYHLFHSARADLLRRCTRYAEAAAAYERALELCENETERAFLRDRLRGVSS